MPLIAMLAKKHKENKEKYGDGFPPKEDKEPALEVAVGLGKKKDDLPPASEDIGEEDTMGDMEKEPNPDELFEGDDTEEENPDEAADELLIRRIVSEMLDERLGTTK